jgi:TRAP-type transport system small permease protein
MTDLAEGAGDEAPPLHARGPLSRIAFAIGSAGLILAMLTDSIAVLGRHTGFALLGSIEVVQSAIVLIASASMVCATLAGGHASVHILTERLKPAMAARLAVFGDVLSALCMLLLVVGSVILLGDLWDGHERTELLHISMRWLRVILIVCLALIGMLFLKAAFVRKRA